MTAVKNKKNKLQISTTHKSADLNDTFIYEFICGQEAHVFMGLCLVVDVCFHTHPAESCWTKQSHVSAVVIAEIAAHTLPIAYRTLLLLFST